MLSLKAEVFDCFGWGIGAGGWGRVELEYMFKQFQELLQSKVIISQRTCPYTQQNEWLNQKNHHLLDFVPTLLFESSIPSTFWVEALSTVVHRINCLPSPKLQNQSP